MTDTTPLPKLTKTRKRAPLSDIETNQSSKHYTIASAGFYADHRYADLSLILKRTQRINQ